MVDILFLKAVTEVVAAKKLVRFLNQQEEALTHPNLIQPIY